MGSLSRLIPGRRLATYYSDDNVWHERIAIWRVNAYEWFVLTPDSDLYPEILTGGQVDGPVKVKIQGEDFRYWSRVGGTVYRFRENIEDSVLRDRINEARVEAQSLAGYDSQWFPSDVIDSSGATVPAEAFGLVRDPRRRLRGKQPRGGQASPGQAADVSWVLEVVGPMTAAPEGKVWLALETMDGIRRGQEIQVRPDIDLKIEETTGLVRRGGGWLKVGLFDLAEVPLPSLTPEPETNAPPEAGTKDDSPQEDAPSDARTLMVDYDSHGYRHKEWRELLHEIKEYQYADWPLEGPGTVVHMVRHMFKYGGDSRQWLMLWSRHRGLVDGDRVMHELRVLVDILWYGGSYDQLNLGSLVCMEVAARRIQAVVDAYSAGGTGAPDWGNARLFTNYVGPEDIVSPQLRTWAARRGKEEVELHQARNRLKELKKGGGAAVMDEAAAAVADGNIAGGAVGRAERRRGKRTKALEAPQAP